MKKSKYKLTDRVVLTPDQFNRAEQESGKGEIAKFEKQEDGNYKLRLAKARALVKAKKKSPRFILYTDQIGRRIFIGDNDMLKIRDEYPITFQRHCALIFYEGFDNHDIKIRHWNRLTGLEFKFKSIGTERKPSKDEQEDIV